MPQLELDSVYEQQILPQLFERLDQAFPEFAWTRSPWGWQGSRRTQFDTGDRHHAANNVTCKHPWGFVDEHGVTTSWLAYVHGGPVKTAEQFSAAVGNLARRAGVSLHMSDAAQLDEQSTTAFESERQRELIEQFAAHCHLSLCRGDDHRLCTTLEQQHGIAREALGRLTLGLYTSAQDIAEHLRRIGFTREEIIQSAVVGDPRLPGRLVIVWRDRFGAIQTIVGRDLDMPTGTTIANLYLKGGAKSDAYGLDVALRPQAGGRDHLLLVDSVLEVAFFQAQGICNVAAVGRGGEPLDAHHWEALADCGVRSATIVQASHDMNHDRVFESVTHLHQAKHAPQVFALWRDQLRGSITAADFVRRHGLEAFQRILHERMHGNRYAARTVVQRHKSSHDWTDAGLLGVLEDAVRFDAAVTDPSRVLDLERFFWPTILESTGVSWNSLLRLLKRHRRASAAGWQHKWHVRNLRQFVADLQCALDADDIDGFRQLVSAAARDLDRNAIFQRDPAPPYALKSLWLEQRSRPGDDEAAHPRLLRIDADLAAEHAAPRPSKNGRSGPSSAEIRALAYALWEQHGRPSGHDQDFWFEAEQSLKSPAKPASSVFPVVSIGDDRAAA